MLTESEAALLAQAVALAAQCPPTDRAFAVGAVLARPDRSVLATGYSRELGPDWHAEAVAIEKARRRGLDCRGADLYCSLEPCSIRLSGRTPCCSHIIAAGIARVVYCLDEPPLFVRCTGAATLAAAGLAVIQDRSLAELVMTANPHIRR